MISWIKKIINYNAIIEDNYRLKKILGMDSFVFFISGSNAEFLKRQVYWINCMDNYRHDANCVGDVQ